MESSKEVSGVRKEGFKLLTVSYLWHWIRFHDVFWYGPLEGWKCRSCGTSDSHLKDGPHT